VKIGLMVGREERFPAALIESINNRGAGVTAEMVHISGTPATAAIPYQVIIDRISHEVPFYRTYLTKAVADGAVIINNPFWWSADNKYFEVVLAERVGVPVPRTVALPNRTYDADIIDRSLRNLVLPIPWEEIAAYTGLPAVLKPATGGGARDVSIVHSIQELEAAWERSGTLTMILQEKIEYQQYVRCFCIARKYVRTAGYDFSRGHFERFRPEHGLTPALEDTVEEYCLRLTRALGYDIDTLEFAVRDNVPIAIDFLNPAPDLEPDSVGAENFSWVLDRITDLAIRAAKDGTAKPPGPNWQAMVARVPALESRPAAGSGTSLAP
jgi:hypothetical protein